MSRWDNEDAEFNVLKGQTLTNINVDRGNNEITFTTDKGEQYKMLHYDDCCESVYIEDICGDIDMLLNVPIMLAEKISNSDLPGLGEPDSYTWTFYKLATILGNITIRWYGESNGYYSESVDFERILIKEQL